MKQHLDIVCQKQGNKQENRATEKAIYSYTQTTIIDIANTSTRQEKTIEIEEFFVKERFV